MDVVDPISTELNDSKQTEIAKWSSNSNSSQEAERTDSLAMEEDENAAYFYEEEDEPDEEDKKSQRRTKRTTRKADQESIISSEEGYVRRSVRDPSQFLLSKGDVKKLLERIVTNDESTVVLKIKEHGLTDINSTVMDEIIKALWKNKVCQALYVQNVSKAMKNPQVEALIKLLEKKSHIWCLNIGENYEISLDMWKKFCKSLPNTNITHLYVSEHVIPIDLKNEMRSHIRENRKKHDKHCSIKNLAVIERCTNMWWNPINGVKELKPKVTPPSHPPKRTVPTIKDLASRPDNTAFWQEGVGKGGDRPWKFKCACGEVCSSYENFRYHPVGRMYECSRCSIWSHVDCVLGPSTTDEDLEEIVDLLCSACNSKISRLKRYYGEDYRQYDDRSDIYELSDKDLVRVRDEVKRKLTKLEAEKAKAGEVAVVEGEHLEKEGASKQSKKAKTVEATAAIPKKKSTTTTTIRKPLRKRPAKKKKEKNVESSELDEIDEDEAEGQWRFKCICGETCSWYENPLYRPKGRKYQCTHCGLWSHVVCMLGERITDEEIHAMENVYCYTCKSKLRRNRSRGTESTDAKTETESENRQSSLLIVEVETQK